MVAEGLSPESGPYTFRHLTLDDFGMLRRWLSTPEVRRWWGDPDTELAMIAGEFGNPAIEMQIVAFEGRDFAYSQNYGAHTWPQPHLAHLPAGTRAIDAFIGEPEMIGGGHGSAFLRLLATRLCTEGVPVVVMDPEPGNLRACRAYHRAGFSGSTVVETESGRVVLMTFAVAGDAKEPSPACS